MEKNTCKSLVLWSPVTNYYNQFLSSFQARSSNNPNLTTVKQNGKCFSVLALAVFSGDYDRVHTFLDEVDAKTLKFCVNWPSYKDIRISLLLCGQLKLAKRINDRLTNKRKFNIRTIHYILLRQLISSSCDDHFNPFITTTDPFHVPNDEDCRKVFGALLKICINQRWLSDTTWNLYLDTLDLLAIDLNHNLVVELVNKTIDIRPKNQLYCVYEESGPITKGHPLMLLMKCCIVESYSVRFLNFLLVNQADVMQTLKYKGWITTPISLGVLFDNFKLVEAFLDAKPEESKMILKNEDVGTILQILLEKGQVSLIKKLVSLGIDILQPSRQNYLPVWKFLLTLDELTRILIRFNECDQETAEFVVHESWNNLQDNFGQFKSQVFKFLMSKYKEQLIKRHCGWSPLSSHVVEFRNSEMMQQITDRENRMWTHIHNCPSKCEICNEMIGVYANYKNIDVFLKRRFELEQYDKCAICWEHKIMDRPLVCTHMFCKECIVKWKKHNCTCPMCRQLIK